MVHDIDVFVLKDLCDFPRIVLIADDNRKVVWLTVFVQKSCAGGKGVAESLDMVSLVRLRQEDGNEMFGLLGAAQGDEYGRWHIGTMTGSAICSASHRQDTYTL